LIVFHLHILLTMAPRIRHNNIPVDDWMICISRGTWTWDSTTAVDDEICMDYDLTIQWQSNRSLVEMGTSTVEVSMPLVLANNVGHESRRHFFVKVDATRSSRFEHLALIICCCSTDASFDWKPLWIPQKNGNAVLFEFALCMTTEALVLRMKFVADAADILGGNGVMQAKIEGNHRCCPQFQSHLSAALPSG
jgi:hypothetical protein